MADLKITDLVGEQEIAKLRALSGELQSVKEVYIEVAAKLAAGLKIEIKSTGDLAELMKNVGESAKTAEENTKKFDSVLQQEQQTINTTTNTIQRQLAEQEKLNREKRGGYEFDKQAYELAVRTLGTREQTIERLTKEKMELRMVKQEQADLNKRLKDATILSDEYERRMQGLNSKENNLKIAIQDLNRTLNNQTKEMQAAEGGYQQLSQRLELMRRAYRQMTEEEKNSESGKHLSRSILDLDAHLKDLDADMGQFQRNVGNYAIANDKLAGSFFSLLGLPPQLSNSLQGCIKTLQDGESVMTKVKTSASSLFKTVGGFLSNPLMLAALGIGGTVAAVKWWFDYNKGLAEATRLTKEFLGITDSGELTQLRDEIKAVADVYGKDYLDVLKTIDTMNAQWGMSAQDALHVVRDGFASGADLGGNMLNLMQQYAPTFHDIGLSASEMTAIIQQTRSGIFSEGGLQAIQMAGVRIRQMSATMKKSLDAIGLSADDIEKKLASGDMSLMDVIGKISSKLRELPPDCEEVGNVLKDVFGRNGAAQGLEMIKNFDKLATDLEQVKETTGEYGELLDKQVEAQEELNKAVSELFDVTDQGFENAMLSLKIIGTELLADIINGVKDIIDWFTQWYDESEIVRGAVNLIAAAFVTAWNVIEMGGAAIISVFKTVGSAAKALGEVIMSIFTWDDDRFNKAVQEWNRSFNSYGNELIQNFKKNGKEAGQAWVDGYNATVNGRELKEPGVSLFGEQTTDENSTKTVDDVSGDLSDTFKSSIKKKKLNKRIISSDEVDKAAKEALKKQKEQEKLEEAAEKARIAREKTNLANRLALAKKGSEEEMQIKLEQLQFEKEQELKAADENGADKTLIEEKYLQKELELGEEYAHLMMENISKRYASESVIRNEMYAKKVKELEQLYAQDLISEEEYEKRKLELTTEYGKQVHEEAIKQVQEQLNVAGLSAEDRQKLEEELSKNLASLYEWEAEQYRKSKDEEVKADEQSNKKRLKNVQTYMQKTAQMISAVTDLFSTLTDAKIEKIEKEEEGLDEQYDKDVERIEMLNEQGVISDEEAEARKRAAEAKTEAKHEELEKKKNQLAYKQAVAEKANKVAQIAISTALAITQALPNIPLSIVVGAIGAVQLAAALAQPIQAYKEGTPEGGHEGGLAIVGDGGKAEIITYNGKAWKTSDKPQLVNLPKGAEVYPDARTFELENMRYVGSVEQHPTAEVNVVNNYKELEKGVTRTNQLLKMQMRQNARLAYLNRFFDRRNDL